MAIPEAILREIIDASTPESSNLPYVKAKYLMIGMSVNLHEYFIKLKAEIEDTYIAPDLIDAAELERIIEITSDEWLNITSVISNSTNRTITIDTDHPAVPSLRLPEDKCVMVLVGDDASKIGCTPTPLTFAEYIDEMRGYKHYRGTTLYGFIRDVTDPDKESFMQNVQSWDELRDWLTAHNAPENVRVFAESAWNRYLRDERML